MMLRSFRFTILFAAAVALAGCATGSMHRDDLASMAKKDMVGLSREDVLACMGPPRKKATEGGTDVWSYLSTDARGTHNGGKIKTSYYEHSSSSHDRNFCIVNVVLREGVVAKVHYLGPKASSFLNENDQCAYAVSACVEDRE